MRWGRKKKGVEINIKVPEMEPVKDIDAHHKATKEAVSDFKNANKKLETVLRKNHFTLAVTMAMTGETKLKRRNK